MRSKVSILILLVLVCWAKVQAQQLIPMGTWRSHFNYEKTYLVESTASNIFVATSYGLMYFDTEENSINKLSKVDGLSDVGITALAYNSEDEYLALGYLNGNVDIITSEGILNLPILLESDITENKTINHISFYNGNINLSTDFGLLVLTPDNQVLEAYQNLGENGEVIEVRGSTILDDVMYLATEDGLLSGNLTSGDNLQDFNNWDRFKDSALYGIDLVSVSSVNGKVYAAKSDSLLQLSGGTWNEIELGLNSNELISHTRIGLNVLLIVTNQRVILLNDLGKISNFSSPEGADINDIIMESSSVFWYADASLGLSKFENGTVEHIVLNGPLNDIKKLKVENGEIYAFPQLENDFSNPISIGLGFSVFRNGEWETRTPVELEGFSNISDVAVINDKTYVASFGFGILDTQKNEVIDYTNSPLDETASGTGNTLVSGLVVGQDDQIWVANFSTFSLQKWNGSQEWKSFEFGSSAASEPTAMTINANNQIWMSIGQLDGRGVLGYDIEADVSRYVTASSTGLPSDQVNDIVFGKSDEVWFATDKGIAYFPYSFGIIEDQSVDVSLPLFENRVLLEDKRVNALAIDGGNRVWIGTEEGLWLFDESFNNLVEYFTVANSPLPSNKIQDLALHPETGELFVATDQGVVSYRTNATVGTNVHYQVKIFPNPVSPDFEGWVGFSGLANDVRVKITTISGQLVREFNAAGGGASWDVRDYTGQRVSTGVYLVFSADQAGEETFVGKIAIID